MMKMSVDGRWWYKYVRGIAILCIIAVIIGLHGVWLHYFATAKHGEIHNGMLDLQQWDTESGEVLTLDGEWEFYPSSFVVSDAAESMQASQPILVPGTWTSALGDEFGYATYRLRVQLDPAKEQTYAIYVPSIQTASKLYINGELAGGTGQPGKSADSYTAFNIPYIVEAKADEQGVIDIAIETANFVLAGFSGIEQAPQFGEQSVIVKRNQLSIIMQQLVFVIFLMHAVYAVHLYMMGIRNKQLLYLALLLVMILLILAGNGNKLIYNWLPLTYIADYRLKGMLLAFGGIALLLCCIHASASKWLKYTSRALMACGLILAFYSLMTADVIPSGRRLLFPLFVIVSVIVSIIGIIRNRKLLLYRNSYMLFLLTALFGMVIWEYAQILLGVTTLFYPIDLIIAMFCMSSLMFKSYLNMADQNRQLVDRLRHGDKLKDQFLANTSHELRNPLHGILNLSYAVLERSKTVLDQRSLRNLELVLAIGRRMNILLGDLLDISKLKEQGIQLTKTKVDLHQAVEKTIDSLKYLLQGKEVRLVNDVPPQLLPVLADENRLTQILFNLLHNAIKFTERGRIVVQAEEQEGKVQVSVADTGKGISPDMIAHIFNSYQQISPHDKAGDSGFGLGLSISKQLVELHGGKLQVQSNASSGSTFYFSIPLAGEALLAQTGNIESTEADWMMKDKGNAQAEQMTANAIKMTEDYATMYERHRLTDLASSDHLTIEQQEGHEEGCIKILVVDDDPVNLQVLYDILNPNNELDIHCVTTALEVLERLADQEWDLVISDVMMPDMSGYALTSLIRETFGLNELPVLLLTARNGMIDIEAGLLAGANDYITKPVNAIELYARVRTLIRLKRSHQEALSLEAAWLQAQIKPHFVVNTLNSIVALSAIDQNKMIELVNEFSQYLRASYNTYSTNRLVSLKQELGLVRSYLSIQKKRFGDQLLIYWDIEDDIRLLIPPLVLQSIIENAVTHGVLSRSSGGYVSITIRKQHDKVHFSITDNGVGISEDKIESILRGHNKNGIGLYNTNLRLKQYYRTGLSISSHPEKGTEVSFTIPLQS